MATATQAPADAAGPTSHTLFPDGPDFEDAVRSAERARLLLTGPAGSGKTWSGLSIGTGMLPEGGTLGVIDTERGRAGLYAGLFAFKHLKLTSFEPQALIRALAVAADRGIDVLLLDTITPYWSGRGGALAQVDALTAASGSKNSFTSGWKDVTPLLHDMLDAILSYPGHIIATVRVKTEWVLQENERGQKEPKKLGTKLDQRDGVDYEFDLVGALNQEHTLTVDKSHYPTIGVGTQHQLPDFSFGRTVVDWLDDGERHPLDANDYRRLATEPDAAPQFLLELLTEVDGRGLSGAAVLDLDRKATTLADLIRLMGSAARAKDPEITPDDLRALHQRMGQARRLERSVPGVDGTPIPLGDLIRFAATGSTDTDRSAA